MRLRTIMVFRTHENMALVSAAMPNSYVIDVRANNEVDCQCTFNPFYKWGNISIPYSEPDTASSVSAVMDKLKVQDNPTCFYRGIDSHVILNIDEAKRELLYPTYKWVLDHKLQPKIVELRNLSENMDIVILDYPKNTKGIELYTGEISIGFLLKAYLEGSTPYEDVYEYKEEYKYITNHKRIHGYKRLIRRVLKEIPPLTSSKENQQLELPW